MESPGYAQAVCTICSFPQPIQPNQTTYIASLTICRKIVLSTLFSSGIFVIAASIIRTTLSLSGSPSTSNIVKWGVRETFMGVITTNVPILKPLVTKAFWKKGSPSGLHHNGDDGYDLDTSTRSTRRTTKPWSGGPLHSEDGFDVEDDICCVGSQSEQQVMITTTIDVQVHGEPIETQSKAKTGNTIWDRNNRNPAVCF